MRWLKTLVIGMGAAILIGLTVVVVELVQRAGEPTPSEASSPRPPAPPVIGAPATHTGPAPTRRFGNIEITIPPGATTEEIASDKTRIVVRLRLADGRAALLLVDAVTGEKMGLITLDNRGRGP